ncbi:alpha/beta fold hydrolase [Stackebrandtia soli]|uniref:alpha/beta fold hydrolase n=1 Tax=Stackebrandtia soli TaxID=1892856 RepID=UPI0039E87F59
MTLDADSTIAVVGMAGRFASVRGLDALWRAMNSENDLLTRYPALPDGRVPAYGVMPDADAFDASFFAITDDEALILDPQHRVLLECAWEALEHAGHDPAVFDGHIGVYAGVSESGHLLELFLRRRRLGLRHDQLHAASDVAELTGRIAYLLGLTGPALGVQAACASSGVSIHLACQALLAGDCDMALAGGASVHVPHETDISGSAGSISADGHHRALDARGDGIVMANGAGLVVLKRLSDAIADGDTVHALVRGSAVHNDGSRKPDYTSLSVDGVSDTISAACQVADVDPATIGYAELGSGFRGLGDLELAGMRRVFLPRDAALPSCRVGSLKALIGYTDAAGGVLALILVILALRHERLPATIGLAEVNPGLGVERNPFTVGRTVDAWPRTSTPRRAGISNWGHGGNNTYLVIEEAPTSTPHTPATGPQLFPVSARTPEALCEYRDAVAAAAATTSPHDLAWTLQIGRRAFEHRACVVHPAGIVVTGEERRELGFVYDDLDATALAAARHRYDRDSAFASRVDACAAVCPIDPRPALRGDATDPDALRYTSIAVAYALTGWWNDLGVTPTRVAGTYAPVLAAVRGDRPLSEAVAAAESGSTSTLAGVSVDPGPVARRDRLWIALTSSAPDAVSCLGLDESTPLVAVASVWVAGHEIRWEATHETPARRVPAPTYPFQRRAYRLPEPDEATPSSVAEPRSTAVPIANPPRTDVRPRWLLSRRQDPAARQRLYCFPHSGGAAGEYMAWSDPLPGTEVWAVQLPGRGSRFSESHLTSVDDIVKAMIAEVDFQPPYTLFGHSFGALLAFEVARGLAAAGRPAPERLILSACGAPETLDIRDTPLYMLDDDAFVSEMERLYGTMPSEIRDDPDVRALALPSLRSDMRAAEDYRFVDGNPLSTPIVALGGRDDYEDEPKLAAWARHTRAAFSSRMFAGGHFYFRDRPDDFFAELARLLADPS